MHWEQPAVFNSWETFWFSALKCLKSLIPKMTLYACVGENYTDIFHGQYLKVRKIILLFHINKGSRIWFCAVFQLIMIYMCAKNKTIASQNSWLYVIQICQISCAELEIPALLLFWFLSHISLSLHLYICRTVLQSLSYFMNPAQEVWSGTCWPAAYTIWSQEIKYKQCPTAARAFLVAWSCFKGPIRSNFPFLHPCVQLYSCRGNI